jgi:hypothetical protein
MILNDKPNYQVSRILMNPRPILSDSSENDPLKKIYLKIDTQACEFHTQTSHFHTVFRFLRVESTRYLLLCSLWIISET